MTIGWNWVPDTALNASCVLGALDEALSAWSRRWFVEGLIRRRGLEAADAPNGSLAVWAAQTPRLALSLSDTQRAHLTGLATDMAVDRLEAASDDQALLETVATALSDDLVRTLDAALGEGVSAAGAGLDGPSGLFRMTLVDDRGRSVASVWLSRAALAASRLAHLPGRRGAPRLCALREALGETAVTLTIRLGAAELGLGDVQSLAPGDVVVLDRALDDALAVLADVNTSVASARLVDVDDPTCLRLFAA